MYRLTRPLIGATAILFAATPAIAQQPTAARDTAPVIHGGPWVVRAERPPSPTALTLVTSESVDRRRTRQLRSGVRTGESLMLRSASSLTSTPLWDFATLYVPDHHGWRAAGINPQILLVSNSAIPFSQNYGSLWAGKGVSSRTMLGANFGLGAFTLILAPEVLVSANANWPLRQDYYQPAIPKDRAGGGYVLPYYIGQFSIDQPMRFGSHPIQKVDPGQSTLMVSGRRFAFGVSSESEWWGPGLRNAIVLSNNAPGFPHLFARTARPLATRFGALEVRWLVGGLTESKYFDTVSTNNTRSIASFAANIQTKWDPNLSIGFARSVYANAKGWNRIPLRWLDVFSSNRTAPKNAPVNSTEIPGGRDQLYSIFARWVFPQDGVEVYTEWARTELPRSIKDFLVAPNHTQGYTLGLQWLGPEWRTGNFRIQGEITQLEQSATYRDRPVSSWYTSRRVIQGYTNQGEVLGASIGPGASSQFLATDYVRPSWRLGAFAGRIRWNEDVHDTFGFPAYVSYCNHDVTIYPGVRAAHSGGWGQLSAEFALQNRLNAFFQNGGGCPNNGRRLDIRNNTLSVSFSPFAR
jgi:hypothetical protein